MMSLVTRAQLDEALARFRANRFEYVLMRDPDDPSSYWHDNWAAFADVVRRDYFPVERCGSHVVWRLRVPGGAMRPPGAR
jgi:hypothetical protein